MAVQRSYELQLCHVLAPAQNVWCATTALDCEATGNISLYYIVQSIYFV